MLEGGRFTIQAHKHRLAATGLPGIIKCGLKACKQVPQQTQRGAEGREAMKERGREEWVG